MAQEQRGEERGVGYNRMLLINDGYWFRFWCFLPFSLFMKLITVLSGNYGVYLLVQDC